MQVSPNPTEQHPIATVLAAMLAIPIPIATVAIPIPSHYPHQIELHRIQLSSIEVALVSSSHLQEAYYTIVVQLLLNQDYLCYSISF